MQTLRTSRWIACLVLAWFAVSMGVAVASPLVNPQAVEFVCSGSGAVKLLVSTDEGLQELSGTALDCPACLPVGVLPVSAQNTLPAPMALGTVLPARLTAHIPWRTAAPLPARGPPSLF